MRQYLCECLSCGFHRQQHFIEEPYPEFGDIFPAYCPNCNNEQDHTRMLTRKAAAELRRCQEEEKLKNSIIALCEGYGFKCRFLYQSVIITTPIADWCFDYHETRKTLYHESTTKVNFATGDYAKAHTQFKGKKMSVEQVIEYIAKHDAWRAGKMNVPKHG